MTRASVATRRSAKGTPRKPRSKGRAPRALLRVNARLDGETAAILRQLVRATGLSVTDVIKLSLVRLSEQQDAPEQPVAEAFADLVGCFDGGVDLSTSYKDALTASLAGKHGTP